MAKVLIGTDYGSYIFDAPNNTIIFTLPEGSIVAERLLLVTHCATGTIIYNFADATLGGNASGNLFVLNYDCSNFDYEDNLQVWYYAPTVEQPIIDQQLRNDISSIKYLTEALVTNTPIPDTSKRQRVILEGTNNINAITSVTTVSTVSTVTQLNNIGAYNATPHIPYTTQIPIEILMQKIVVS